MSYPSPPQEENQAKTQPMRSPDRMAQFQPVTIYMPPPPPPRPGGCTLAVGLAIALPVLAAVLLLAVYLLAPLRTNLLILGIDRPPKGTVLSRTDTIILVGVTPTQPTIRMLSIPRDLWVPIPGQGENRINTAHFYAEASQPGSGPAAALKVVEDNFHVSVPFYVRFQFDGVVKVIDAMGGVDVDFPAAELGFDPGIHRLNGTQALAFVRDRKGTDDFFRMDHGQLLIKAVISQELKPAAWPRIPGLLAALDQATDTNIPAWDWPRLGVAVLRAGPTGIDNRILPREMATPFVTSGGADVLQPHWDLILPLVQQMFGN